MKSVVSGIKNLYFCLTGMKRPEAKKRIEELRKEIEEHNNNYYVLNHPVITDFELTF